MSELMEDGYPEDLTGLKFGKLTVMYKYDSPKRSLHHCKCDCGNEIDVLRANLIHKNNTNCGKCKYDQTVKGDSKTRFYHLYRHMIGRCTSKDTYYFTYYGKRGIIVCDRWLECYGNFKEDMYESYLRHVEEYGEKDTTLDRIDVNGNYCPENCRWATIREQAYNRTTNRVFEFDGNTETLTELANKYGICVSTLRSRLSRGLNIEEALIAEVRPSNKIITCQGLSLRQHCIKYGLVYNRIRDRILHGWDLDSAIEAPKGMRYKTWLKMKENNKNSLDNSE